MKEPIAVITDMCENRDGTEGCVNSPRPLTTRPDWRPSVATADATASPLVDSDGSPVLLSATHLLQLVNAGAERPITYRQLDYWTRTGAIGGTIAANGSGKPRRYTRGDAMRLRRIRRWIEFTGSQGEHVHVARLWRANPYASLTVTGHGCTLTLPAEVAA
jgi:hypothetical protein